LKTTVAMVVYLPTCGPGITRQLAVFMGYSNLAFNCNCRAV